MRLKYKDYFDISLDIKKNIGKLPLDIDLVVGIPRSGMIPAYMLGFILNTRVCSIDEYIHGLTGSHGDTRFKPANEKIEKVVVIDDTVSSGKAMSQARASIERAGFAGIRYYYTAVYTDMGSEKHVDIALCKLTNPRMFQWNYLNHWLLTKACVDLDGVLCRDPDPAKNDDGEKYREFIMNAPPLHIPQHEVLAIVTSRLEKYRKETEMWLAEHKVAYSTLYMLPLETREERIRADCAAEYKAEIYKKLGNSVLFLESDREQAVKIAEMTGKTVICVGTDELINAGNIAALKILADKRTIKRILKKLYFLIPSKGIRNWLEKLYRKGRRK
jgi:uncharacterized HAD superfamily protein/hypoxanthine phosphoribosyltransferase